MTFYLLIYLLTNRNGSGYGITACDERRIQLIKFSSATTFSGMSVLYINSVIFQSFCSIDKEKNRLGLSLLEKDTGVPENISKEFRKHLRASDVGDNVQNDSNVTASKKSVKRKADADVAEDVGSPSKRKRAKVEPVRPSSKKTKEVSLCRCRRRRLVSSSIRRVS